MSFNPPLAAKRPHTVTHHGRTLTDHYEWLRDADNPEVLQHLREENSYTEQLTADQQPLREQIFAEIKSHTIETDLSVPIRRDDWWYFVRTREGSQYPIHCRVAAENTGDLVADWTPPVVERDQPLSGEQVILDANEAAEGHPFFSLGGMSVSPDGNTLAYLVDTTGNELYRLLVRDLTTGEDHQEDLTGVFAGLSFDRTGQQVFYCLPDDSWRPNRVMVHRLGASSSADQLIYQEPDQMYWTGFSLSADRTELIISSGTSEISETRVLALSETDPSIPAPQLAVSRQLNSLHTLTPVVIDDQRFYLIVHDRNPLDGTPLPNNTVSMVAAQTVTEPETWRTVMPHSTATKIDEVDVNRTHAIVSARVETTPRTMVIPLDGLGTENQQPAVEPQFPEELFSCELVSAPYQSPLIRLSYSSWVTPVHVLDYDPTTRELSVRRRQEVPDYDPSAYLVERWWAPTSRPEESVAIPLSIIRHRDVAWDGSNPALLYGYGSYEISMDPFFAPSRLSLLDRGVVFVVIHVRGGGELGRPWYEHGKKLHKKNSFTDFVDATRFVASSGWVDPDRIVAMGGSAGGLLMGAVANLAPELYRAILADVPFVDVLTSMLDPDLPLTTLEWDEWGNPLQDPEAYDYMASYTPYTNVRPVDYPAIAAVTSLHDTRVLYVEPAKWVQQLRQTVTSRHDAPVEAGGSPVLLKIEMDGGHGGASGRYRMWEDQAWEYAFLLTALNATERRR
ncbi:S9 family peptidase [Auritidibacter ignavus]|uniref:S9 family peptidase n=1 Tax=Auritidibacter ignavus TaxID=678932 RepID=UPI000F019853|nr:S9 family peptidase [Auritidibacter ignavus]NIH71356.1 oligopeptidase B [Auritidibacter ignavus]RMX23475.1 S9 family peptidase [Auritidibacter ignavus]WGH85226.1 S9 family peptidase [Auritidibacter ignavus]WGH87514.1 S9 family peptidase [Auritidibacter ignavus]